MRPNTTSVSQPTFPSTLRRIRRLRCYFLLTGEEFARAVVLPIIARQRIGQAASCRSPSCTPPGFHDNNPFGLFGLIARFFRQEYENRGVVFKCFIPIGLCRSHPEGAGSETTHRLRSHLIDPPETPRQQKSVPGGRLSDRFMDSVAETK